MKHRHVSTILMCIALGLAISGSGCESDKDSGPAYGWIRVVNESSHTIAYLYISSTSLATWGPDHLGTEDILPGETYTVSDIEVGDYDLKAENPDHEELVTRYGVTIGENGFQWTLID